MKLLICTQALDQNESNLGFFVEWVRGFAKECEQVTVICLREGAHDLPANVKVYSLGKEKGGSRLGRWWRALAFIVMLRSNYDTVLVHMNPEYVLAGGWLWKLSGKKVGLWYAHKSVTLKLRLAMLFIDRVFTVSADSFKYPTSKLCVVGHGIDTTLFAFAPAQATDVLRIFVVGRISPSKHLVEMLDALDVLHARGRAFEFTVIGAPLIEAEHAYEEKLRTEAAKRPYAGRIIFAGAIEHAKLPQVLAGQQVSLNFSETGNMDKVGLEALAMGIPLVSCNPPFKAALSLYGLFFDRVTDAEAAANAIEKAAATDPAPLSEWVRKHHSLQSLIPRIVAILKGK